MCWEVFAAKAFQLLSDWRADWARSKKDTLFGNGEWSSPDGPTLFPSLRSAIPSSCPMATRKAGSWVLLPVVCHKSSPTLENVPASFSLSSLVASLLLRRPSSFVVKLVGESCFELLPPYHCVHTQFGFICPEHSHSSEWKTLAKTTAKSLFSNTYHSKWVILNTFFW